MTPVRQTSHDLRQHWVLTQHQSWIHWQSANISRLRGDHQQNLAAIQHAKALKHTLRFIQMKHALLCGWQSNDEFFNP